MHQQPGLRFAILWFDDDILEVRVEANNGWFAGTADCYAAHDVFAQLAATARGFPTSPTDRRELTIGTFDAAFAGGGARVVLRCRDWSGHAIADVALREGNRTEVTQTATFSVPFEAAALDRFVAALAAMPLVDDATAELPMAN